MYFTRNEFNCNCANKHCNGKSDSINPLLIQLLNRVRVEFNKPIVITSGFRCNAHNESVGGASASKHLTGEAADIRPASGKRADLDLLYELLNDDSECKGLGDGRKRGFIHVDVRTGSKKRFSY